MGGSSRATLLSLAFMLAAAGAFCATKTWQVASGNWGFGGNWSGGTVPAAGDDVIIPTGDTCNINAGALPLPTLASFTLNSGATLTVAAAATLTITGDVVVQGTYPAALPMVLTGASGQNLTMAAGSALGNLTINSSSTTTLQSAITVAGNLTITAGTLDANSTGNYQITVRGNWTNSSTFRPRAGLVVLGSTSAAQTVNSGGTTFYSLTVNNTSGLDPAVTFASAIATNAAGVFTHTAGIINLAGFTLTANGTSSLGSTIQSGTAATVTFSGAVSLTGTTSITSGGGAVSFGAAVNNGQSLTVDSGAGTTSFSAAVGGGTPLASLSVTSSNAAMNAITIRNVTTTGTQTYTGNVTLGASTSLATTNSDVSFTAAVNGANALSISAGSGVVSLGTVVGSSTALSSVTVSSAGTTSLPAVTTSGAQSYTASTSTTLNGTLTVNTAGSGVSFSGPVVIGTGGGTISLTGTNAGNTVTFGATSTVNATSAGSQSLSITAGGGAVTFNADVGATTPPGTVTVSSSLTTSLRNVTTTGAQSYTASTSTTVNGTLTVNTAGAGVSFTGPVILAGTGATITLTGSSAGNAVTFSATSTVNGTTSGSQSLSITAGGGPVTFNAAVGNSTPPSTVTVSASATTSLQAVTTTGAQSYTAATSTTLNGTLTVNTAGAGVSFTGPVLLAAGGGTITLTGSNASNNVTFSATSTVSGAQPLQITAGGGTVTMNAAVGNPTSLSSLSIVSAAQFTTAAAGTISVSGAGAVSITTDGVTLGASVTTASGTITIQPATAGQTIGINDASGGLNITTAMLGLLSTSGTVIIGSTSGTGAITVGSLGNIDLTGKTYSLTVRSLSGNLTFNLAGTNSLSLASTKDFVFALGTGTITHAGTATADVTLSGTGTLSFTSGSVGTVGTPIPVSVPNLGTSTISGGLYLTDVTSLNVTGAPVNVGANPVAITVTGGGTLAVSGTITNGGGATASTMSFTADDMNLTGTITAGAGAVTLTSTIVSQPISLGTGSTPLGLSSAELNTITTTGTLTIGDVLHTGNISTDGNVNLTGPSGPVILQTRGSSITIGNQFSTGGDLTLDTRGSSAATGAVTGAGQLTVGAGGASSLTVNASTGINLSSATNLANAVTLSNNASGSVTYNNNRNMTLVASNSANNGAITVQNNTGTLTTAGNISETGGGTSSISLSSAGLLTVSNAVSAASGSGGISLSGGGITVNAVTVNAGSGAITINGGVAAIDLTTSTLTTTNATAGAVLIRNATTATLGNITASGVGAVVALGSGQDITGLVSQTAGTVITATSLTASTNGVVTLTNANQVTTLASVARGGAFSFTNNASLITSGGIASVGAGSDPVTITTTPAGSSLTIGASIADTSGNISLTSGTGGVSVSAGVTIGGAASTGTILIDGGGGPLSFSTSSTLSTTSASASAVIIRNASAASIGNISAPNGTVSLGTAALPISGAITETGGAGAITVTSAGLLVGGGTLLLTSDFNLTTDFTVASGTVTLDRALTISGTLTIGTTGVLDVSASSFAVTIGLNWANSNPGGGGFVARSGTVTLNAGAATINVAGNNTFYDLSCTVAGTTIYFGAGDTQTIATGGNFTATGTSANHIVLRSTASPTRWIFVLQGSAGITFTWVDVYDSDASANPIVTPPDVNAGPANNDLGWLNSLPVTASVTRDSNNNGKIDAIYVTTAAAINDDFTGFTVSVTSSTGVAYTVTGFADPGLHTSNFYIYLKEQPVLDTGATLNWVITQNTTLLDNATVNKLVDIPSPPAVTADAAAPVVGYTLGVVGGNQVFIHFSELLYRPGGAQIQPADFISSPATISVSTITPITYSGNGISEALLTMSRTITADDVILPIRLQFPAAAPATGLQDAAGNYLVYAAAGHRISDLGLGQLTDGVVEPVFAHDETVRGSTATSSGLIQLGGFDGSKWLRNHQDITIEGHVHTLTTSTYPAAGSARLWYDMNVSSSLTSSSGLWLPGFQENTTAADGFSGLIPTGGAGDSGATQLSELSSSTYPLLRDFMIPRSDPRMQDNATVGFLFQIPINDLTNLLTARVANPGASDWYRHITPWTFALHDVRSQRGGVTILNNVIHPDRGEVTTLQYSQSTSGPVTITVFDLSGSIVNVLTRAQSQSAGDYAVSWDGRNRGGRAVARGIYFIRAVGPGFDETRKVLVVR